MMEMDSYELYTRYPFRYKDFSVNPVANVVIDQHPNSPTPTNHSDEE